MKHNLVPALIIAAAMLGCGFFVHRAATTSAASQFDALLDQMEAATQKTESGGDSRATRIIKGLSSSVAEGVKAGVKETFSNSQPDQDAVLRDQLQVRDKLEVRDVKLAPSNSKNQERLIGVVWNNSDKIVTNVQLNVTYRDKAGALLDVGSAHVSGTLRPGEQVGFECSRSLGDYREKDEVLAERKASSAEAKINNFKAVDVSSGS